LGKWRFSSRSPETTRQLGELLGTLAQPGTVLALEGDLGSGKTCLTQGFARGAGVPDDQPVTSPTYTLMNHYQGRIDLYHFDFFRLNSPEDLEDLGFDEDLHRHGVVIYEWSQRFDDLDLDALHVSMAWVAEQERDIALSASGPVAAQMLESARREWLTREES